VGEGRLSIGQVNREAKRVLKKPGRYGWAFFLADECTVFLRWAVSCGLVDKDPMRTIRTILPQTLPKAPPSDEVVKLLGTCGRDWLGIRNRTLISVLADSGLRRAEVVRLRIGDVYRRRGESIPVTLVP